MFLKAKFFYCPYLKHRFLNTIESISLSSSFISSSRCFRFLAIKGGSHVSACSYKIDSTVLSCYLPLLLTSKSYFYVFISVKLSILSTLTNVEFILVENEATQIMHSLISTRKTAANVKLPKLMGSLVSIKAKYIPIMAIVV